MPFTEYLADIEPQDWMRPDFHKQTDTVVQHGGYRILETHGTANIIPPIVAV